MWEIVPGITLFRIVMLRLVGIRREHRYSGGFILMGHRYSRYKFNKKNRLCHIGSGIPLLVKGIVILET